MSETLLAPTVWVMQPSGNETDGYWFPWAWRLWKREQSLILEDDTRAASSMGTATFQLLRQTRLDPQAPQKVRGKYQRYTGLVIPGAYICVVRSDGVLDRSQSNWPLDPTKILWWGTIGAIHKDPKRGTDDYTGSVEAHEIGHLLDSQRVRAPWVKSFTTQYAQFQLSEGPTANLEGKGGQIIGNAIAGKVSATDPTEVYLYAPTAAQCGTATTQLFTRWRVLRHICTMCSAFGLPRIDLDDGGAGADPSPDATTVPGYLNLTDAPEVLDPWSATYRGAFDLLAPESHSLQWRVDINPDALDHWLLRIVSTNSEAGYGMPVGTAVAVTLDRDETFRLTDARADMPDEVAVQGQRCRFMATVAVADGNLGAGWSAALETAYEAAKQEDRSQPRFADVFSHYVLMTDAENRLRVKPDPGTGAGIGIPFCLNVSWNGTAVTLTSSIDYTPYFPATQLVAALPWPVGLKGDGTDSRGAADKAAPSYITPKVFYVDSGAWYDLSSKNTLVSEVPGISLDDRGPALRIEYGIPHMLGKDTFVSADVGGELGTLDYRKLAATVAIDSAQPVYVSRARPGVANGATTHFSRVRSRLLVEDHRLQFWAALKGTALGIVKTTTPTVDRVTATNEPGGLGYILRNDFPLAQRYCNRLAAWAFRARQAGEIVLIRPDDPPAWARPGTILGVVTDIAQPHELNTAARSVRRTWSNGRARLMITTDLPVMPTAPGTTVSPAGGGPVSPALGGTVPQALAALANDVRALEGASQRQVVIPPRTTSYGVVNVLSETLGTDVLVTVGGTQYKGIISPGTVPTEVPQLDPSALVTFPAYLGKARLNGGAYVWVGIILKPSGVNIFDLLAPLPSNQKFQSRMTVQMPITGGGGATATVYLPWTV